MTNRLYLVLIQRRIEHHLHSSLPTPQTLIPSHFSSCLFLGPDILRQRLVRIENAVGIKQPLHLEHHLDRRLTLAMVYILVLGEPQSVFGADAAAALGHVVVDEGLDE